MLKHNLLQISLLFQLLIRIQLAIQSPNQCQKSASKTNLELCKKKKDGSNSIMKFGGECTQMNQDAMLVFI
jgi:hypothetical protein